MNIIEMVMAKVDPAKRHQKKQEQAVREKHMALDKKYPLAKISPGKVVHVKDALAGAGGGLSSGSHEVTDQLAYAQAMAEFLRQEKVREKWRDEVREIEEQAKQQALERAAYYEGVEFPTAGGVIRGRIVPSGVTWDPVRDIYLDRAGREVECYTDELGRAMWRPVEKVVVAVPDPEPEPPKPVHKAGHFPIQWAQEATDRCNESDYLIRVEFDSQGQGIDVIGHHGEEYAQHHTPWVMLEKALVNPLILAIENVERQLRVVASLRKANG